jgi:hypothetical protein
MTAIGTTAIKGKNRRVNFVNGVIGARRAVSAGIARSGGGRLAIPPATLTFLPNISYRQIGAIIRYNSALGGELSEIRSPVGMSLEAG